MELPVPVVIRSQKKVEEIKQELSDWLLHDEPKPLTFKDMGGRYYLAYYQGADLSEHYKYAKGTLTFYLPMGNRFGDTKQLPVTTTFSTFTITGQDKTPWISSTTFTAPVSSYVLETDKGGRIELKYSFIAGDVLEIDYEKRKISLNGKNIQTALQIVPTRWFRLEPGAVQLKASHATTVEYTERFY